MNKQTQADHECSACGGTGRSALVVAYGDVLPGDRVWNRFGYSSPIGHWTEVLAVKCDGPQHGLTTRDGYTEWGFSREGIAVTRGCLVCLGAGRISDRMPVADALADAETLRLNTSVLSIPDSTRYQFSKRQWDSTLYGPFAMYELGAYLARAAFRAVPGLRG